MKIGKRMTYQLDRHSDAYKRGEKAYISGENNVHKLVTMNGGFTAKGDFTEYGFNLYEGFKEAEIKAFFAAYQA